MRRSWKQRVERTSLHLALLFLALSSPALIAAQDDSGGITPMLFASARSGNADAEAQIGYAYQNRKGLRLDESKAKFWYEKAAAQGNVAAEIGLAVLYSNDFQDPEHTVKAISWYRKAAEQGNVYAQKDLAAIYEEGDERSLFGLTPIIPVDYGQAAYWYRKAAEQGDEYAEFALGMLYEYGEGVAQSDTAAAGWLFKSADQGDSQAAYELGMLYLKNPNREYQDYGAQCLSVASARGNEMARQALEAFNERREQEQERKRIREERVFIGVSAFAFIVAAGILVHYRKRCIAFCMGHIPRSTRVRQLLVSTAIACWCSGCSLYELLDTESMRHPVNAAITALLLCVPALVLGGVALWWISTVRPSVGPIPMGQERVDS